MAEMVGYPQLQARFRAISSDQVTEGLMKQVALAVVREQKLLASRFRKTGNLERGIVIKSVSAVGATVVSSANYSGFVEGGTGLFGPRHARITPKAASVLAWRTGATRLTGSSRTKGGRELAGWAFARSVAGRPATPYFFPGAKVGLQKTGADSIVQAWNDAA